VIGISIGMACRNRAIPFVSNFAAFFIQKFDHVRTKGVKVVSKSSPIPSSQCIYIYTPMYMYWLEDE
jgi:hypothetical protein